MLTRHESWRVENVHLSLGWVKTNCLAVSRDDGIFIITALRSAEADSKQLRVELEQLRGHRPYG